MEIRLLGMNDVQRLLTMREALSAVETAFREKSRGNVEMPPKVYVFLERFSGDFRVMPAYMSSLNAAGVKVVNVHLRNRERGLPTVMASILLLDPETGRPEALLDGTLITGIRTGAAGGIAASALARKNSRNVCFVGCGTQAIYQLSALREVLGGFEGSAYDVSSAQTRSFVEFAGRNGVALRSVDGVGECAEGADIIVTTTPARGPVVMDEWVHEGVHINAIGADAPGKEELDPRILRRARIFVDDVEQASHSGEINVPLSKGIISRGDIAGELGDVLEGKVRGRTSDRDVTVFDSTGLAIQDIAVASLVYEKAVKLNIGSTFQIF